MEKQEKRLSNLPPSDHEYWEDADVELSRMDVKSEHTHVFKEVSSREIRCDCGVGFFIGLGDTLKEGHLYHNEELVI